jgi:hypothetical protein
MSALQSYDHSIVRKTIPEPLRNLTLIPQIVGVGNPPIVEENKEFTSRESLEITRTVGRFAIPRMLPISPDGFRIIDRLDVQKPEMTLEADLLLPNLRSNRIEIVVLPDRLSTLLARFTND